jgi:hypothetical protein
MENEMEKQPEFVVVPRRKMTDEERDRLAFVVGEMDRLRRERDELVAEFYTKGADYEEMADAMGKTRNAAVMMIRNLRRAGVDVGPYRRRGPRKSVEA